MEEKEVNLKKGFFKKIKISTVNIEKYPELAAEKVSRAINYLAKLVAILVIVICAGMIYKTTQVVNQVIDYIEKEFPDFSYQDGLLDVKSETPITIENEALGTVIIDTSTEEQENITNQLEEKENCIILLKNEVMIKNNSMLGTATYKYDEMLGQMGLTSFNKQDVINYARGTQMINIYISLGITLFIYAFVIYFINTLANSLFISIFGHIANLLTKVKMRYSVIFSMSIYASTLSILLNIIYVIINTFTNFEIQYFDVMYMSVAVIYLISAIFMIKVDLQKRQVELMKIQEVQEQVRKEIEEKETEEKKDENEKPEEEPNEKKKKEEKEKKEKGDSEKSGPEPEGTSA